MNTRLLQLLACPECAGDRLALDVLRQEAGDVVEGVLACDACRRRFPVIGGVPRLLPDALIGVLPQYHPAFFARYQMALPTQPQGDALARTLRFYSFARPKLFSAALEPELLAYWRRSLRTRIPALTHLSGRLGLDAGCGEGRYTYCLAEEGAEVVGLDVSGAVNQAYRRNRTNPRVHIVQGSIYQPPLRRGIFDVVMSTGVLHHLPDPEGGFDALVPLLHAGGAIHVWVYGLRRMSLVYRISHLTLLHRLLGRLSSRASYLVSVPLALALHLLVFQPTRVLDHTPARARIHPQLRELAALPFKMHLVEVHDRIGVPVTHFLTEQELRGWYERAGLAEIGVVQTGGGRGWSAWGMVPAGAHAHGVGSATAVNATSPSTS
jgi:uncharacterized protein YbaR (Trm112 family)/SAM-dependent methyltransferase